MRDFGVVHTRFWAWAQEMGLIDTEKLLAFYFLTCEHSNSLGCFRIPKAYIAEDLGYDIDRVSQGIATLSEKGFLAYCDITKHVVVINYLKWNPPQNPKHAKAIIKIANQIPKSPQLIEFVIESLIKYGGTHIKLSVCDTLYHTLSIGYRYTDQDQNQEQDHDQDAGARLKHKNEIELPDWLDAEAWNDFVTYRKGKKTLTKRAAALAITKLTQLRKDGHDPKEVIHQTIMNGWTGLFPTSKRSPDKSSNWKSIEDKNRVAVKEFLDECR